MKGLRLRHPWREPSELETLPLDVTGVIELHGSRAPDPDEETPTRPRVAEAPDFVRVRSFLESPTGPAGPGGYYVSRLLWFMRWGPPRPPRAVLVTVTQAGGGDPLRWPTLPELWEAVALLPGGMILTVPPFVSGTEPPPIPVVQLHAQGAIQGSAAEITPPLPRQ